MSKLKEGLSNDEVKLLNSMFWRSNNYAIAWCYSRMLGTSVAWVLYPYISWLYPNSDKDPAQKQRKLTVLDRESKGFFNITPQVAPLCYSIFAAMTAISIGITERKPRKRRTLTFLQSTP